MSESDNPQVQEAGAAARTAHWRNLIPQDAREMYSRSGFGSRVGMGSRPAILVIDVTTSFCGEESSDLSDSAPGPVHGLGIDNIPAVIDSISSLLHVAHEGDIPVIYTVGLDYREDGKDAGRWKDKNPSIVGDSARLSQENRSGNTIVPDIAPQDGDLVLTKHKPSAFFGTPLLSLLIDLEIDTLIVCGGVTSGCIRASVIEGFSYNYRMNVVEECTFDRSAWTQAANLFDIDNKYGDVISLDEAIAHLSSITT